jgi:hypothetical protein
MNNKDDIGRLHKLAQTCKMADQPQTQDLLRDMEAWDTAVKIGKAVKLLHRDHQQPKTGCHGNRSE